MKIIKPSVEILTQQSGIEMLKQIELAARTCYKTESSTTDTSYINFVQMLINKGHEAMIEFGWVMARFICDRGVLAELSRHRLFSLAVESTRYCSYAKDKFNNELTFIEPCFWNIENDEYPYPHILKRDIWEKSMESAEKNYLALINDGATPQEARSVLPNSLKTEIVIAGNLREWKHMFQLRTSKYAHPQIKEVADMALEQFRAKIPLIFDKLDNVNLSDVSTEELIKELDKRK